jgi:hypothetical protein
MRHHSSPVFASKRLLVQNSLFDMVYSKNAFEFSTPEGGFVLESET